MSMHANQEEMKQAELAAWKPRTKQGQAVKDKKLRNIEDLWRASKRIQEPEVVDILVPQLVSETIKTHMVQKQTRAGQKGRQKALVIVGDMESCFGVGVAGGKDTILGIGKATRRAKMSLLPTKLGFWAETKEGSPHTIPMRIKGKCSSVELVLTPAPRGTGIIAGERLKRFLKLAGIQDCYTSTTGCTKTTENYITAAFNALRDLHSLDYEAHELDIKLTH